MKLAFKTKFEWVDTVNSDIVRFLQDHASCEKKASGTALHLASHYPDRPELVRAMIDLAREELEHFGEVFERLVARDATLAADERDPYIRSLLSTVRKSSRLFLLDRLLVFGIVEARGCERFRMLGEAIEDASLREFYLQLARAEAQHWALFVRLAKTYFPLEEVDARLTELLAYEGELVSTLPLRCALH